jgi:hypothetical protein
MHPEDIAVILLNSVHGKLRHYLALLETPARENRINPEIDPRFIVGSGTRIVHLLAVHNKSTRTGVR